MGIRARAEDWTGLNYDPPSDFREGQNPVPGGPKPLEPIRFEPRLFVPSTIATFMPFALVFGVIALLDLIDVLPLLIICGALLTIWAAYVSWQRLRLGNGAIELGAEGLFVVGTLAKPIPWSAIGEVRKTEGIVWQDIVIRIDPDRQIEHRHPWPVNLIAGDAFGLSLPGFHVSASSMKADVDTLIETIEAYRDNYCG